MQAADGVCGWLSEVAQRLGTADPGVRLGDVLAATFTRPLDDPAYRGNALVPGGWPLEVSFSEVQLDQLRLDLQPSDVECLPSVRRELALQVVRRCAGPGYRDSSAAWLAYTAARRFGAFLGAAFGPHDLTTVKAYLELDLAADPGSLPGRLGRAAALVAEHVPGAVPHLVALSASAPWPSTVHRAGSAWGTSAGEPQAHWAGSAWGTSTGEPQAEGGREAAYSERLYLACRGGLRVLALDGLLARLGLRHRLPALAATVAALTGGRLLLPEDSVLVAIGERDGGFELKVELLAEALAGPQTETLAAIECLLQARPASLAAFRRWRQAVGEATRIGVVSVRLAGDDTPRLNVYQSLTGGWSLPREPEPEWPSR